MNNATIVFSTSPWLLLLIIPMMALIFALVFVRKKKSSRVSANLILSSLLQCAAAVCFIFSIAGVGIKYEEENSPKEAVVLVDTSFSASTQQDNMNDFVKDVLTQSVGKCKVAVVLFSESQQIAINMTQFKSASEVQTAYQKYLSTLAATSSGGATDIGAALKFVWSAEGADNLISDPARARIVILSDGLETDGDALSAMKTLARNGAQIETSFYADNYIADSSILEVSFPQRNIYTNDKFNFNVEIKSVHNTSAVVLLTDKDQEGKIKETSFDITLKSGTHKIALPYSFESEEFHELTFKLIMKEDLEEKNNIFCSYFEVAKKNKILILEKYQDESSELNKMLSEVSEKNNIEIEIKEIADVQAFKAKDFAKYSEVILYNGAANDMQQEFQEELESYVNDLGGGLFTIGGFEKDEQGNIQMIPKESDPTTEVPSLHSYKEKDLYGSVLADLLPVRVEAFKPAVAVVFVFDVSNSMAGSANSALHSAAEDARYIIDHVLEPKDYLGIVTLQTSYTQTDPLSPLTKKDELKETITELEDFYDYYACTQYATALKHATQVLANVPQGVARKHVILFSDGAPGDSLDEYGKVVADAHTLQDISFTIVTYYYTCRYIDGVPYYFNHAYDFPGYEIKIDRMQTLAGYGGGSFVLTTRDKSLHSVAPYFRQDLKLDQLEDICYEDFKPQKGEESDILGDITGLQLRELTLNGYFSSRPKLDSGISVPLLANGSPLYAEWKYGKGKVGSLLIDLEGKWSKDLLITNTGQTIVQNILFSLLMNVQQPENNTFEASLSENNLHTQVNVFNLLQEEDASTKIVALVQSPLQTQKYDLGVLENGSRFVFENYESGVYTIYIMKVSADYDFMQSTINTPSDLPQNVLHELITLHRAFSYSNEYDGRRDAYTTGKDLLAAISTREVGEDEEYSKFIYDADKLFASSGKITNIYDLRQILLIAAMVLYISGIVLRLFKIKKIKRET